MKRLALAALLALAVIGSAFAMREAPEPSSDRWLMLQGRVIRAVRAPERWWRQFRGASTIHYNFSRAAAPAYPADRPRQIDIFTRSQARTQLSPDILTLAGFPEGGGMTAEEITTLFQRTDGVDRAAYMRAIIDRLEIASLPDDAAKVASIVEFAQDAVAHDPVVAPPTYDPVAILELGKGRCGHVNYNVLPALLNAAGFKTRRVRLPAHAALEARYNDSWHFVDADMLKNGDLIERFDGQVPDTEWLTKGSNALLVDTYAAWPDAYAYDGAPVNAAGKRLTGFIGTGNSEDLGYPSSRFGAPLAYPPSPPEIEARELAVTQPVVTLRWGGSYDRDGDLSGYALEIGTAPGRSDTQRLETVEPRAQIELPAAGTYYYRVRALDRHRQLEPRTFYQPSEEGVIRYEPASAVEAEAALIPPKITNGWPVLPRLPAVGDGAGVPLFEPAALDATGEARFFPVDWFAGPALKLVDLSDNRFPGGSIDGPKDQRTEWVHPLEALVAGEPVTVQFDLYLARRGYGGVEPFPVVSVDAGTQKVALAVDPERDQLSFSVSPGESTASTIEPKYWTAYPGEWADPKAGPEVVVARRMPAGPAVSAGAPVAIQPRNAWRVSFRFEPAVSGRIGAGERWRVTAQLNGAPLGTADVDGPPSAIRLLSNPSDEVIYVFDNLLVAQ